MQIRRSVQISYLRPSSLIIFLGVILQISPAQAAPQEILRAQEEVPQILYQAPQGANVVVGIPVNLHAQAAPGVLNAPSSYPPTFSHPLILSDASANPDPSNPIDASGPIDASSPIDPSGSLASSFDLAAHHLAQSNENLNALQRVIIEVDQAVRSDRNFHKSENGIVLFDKMMDLAINSVKFSRELSASLPPTVRKTYLVAAADAFYLYKIYINKLALYHLNVCYFDLISLTNSTHVNPSNLEYSNINEISNSDFLTGENIHWRMLHAKNHIQIADNKSNTNRDIRFLHARAAVDTLDEAHIKYHPTIEAHSFEDQFKFYFLFARVSYDYAALDLPRASDLQINKTMGIFSIAMEKQLRCKNPSSYFYQKILMSNFRASLQIELAARQTFINLARAKELIALARADLGLAETLLLAHESEVRDSVALKLLINRTKEQLAATGLASE